MSIITNPQLPPRPGYVEVEVNGKRQYQRVLTEPERINLLALAEIAETQEVSKTELQLALAEAVEAYVAEAAQIKLALAELAEAIFGGET